jgi:ATP-binding cassette, subfamily B, bacterial PglK
MGKNTQGGVRDIFSLFLDVLDRDDKSKVVKYLLAMFLGGAFSICGVAAVIPLMHLLLGMGDSYVSSVFPMLSHKELFTCLILLLIFVYALKNFISWLLWRYQCRVMNGFVGKLQVKLFRKYINSNYLYHINSSTPKLIKNINNETSALSTYVCYNIGVLITDGLSSLFLVLFLFYVNPSFTLFVTLSILLSTGIFLKYIRRRLTYFSLLRAESWERLTSTVISSLTAIKEIKLYNCESVFFDKYDKNVSKLVSSIAFQGSYSQAPRMLIEFAGISAIMGTFLMFILMGVKAVDMLPLLAVFAIAAAQLLPSLNRVTQGIINLKYGFPALKTVHEELFEDCPFSMKQDYNDGGKVSFKKDINLKNICFSYNGKCQDLKGISLTISRGKKIAIVGESGAGKSTLIDVLLNLQLPDEGVICVDDVVQVERRYSQKYRNLFSYIPQDIVLLDLSIKENVAFGICPDNIDDAKVWESLRFAKLEETVIELPNKEETMIGERGLRLSGGQRQRLAIARALYRDAEVLVMDEATSALDTKTESLVTNLIMKQKIKTVVTIAHRISTIKDYDMIHVMKRGQIVSRGNFEALSSSCEFFKEISKQVSKDKQRAC